MTVSCEKKLWMSREAQLKLNRKNDPEIAWQGLKKVQARHGEH
jgi:hypothetical protein